ncbi:unnamed protein product [Protopolystoma xenopodis]|uniref:Transmembrane protein n=1 Tax=Protopolystoma xenopodis TaxID=117903 RepID=A0A448XI19_9PLAT|nr:unnamed protein product [Protopolystoma xenopodis]
MPPESFGETLQSHLPSSRGHAPFLCMKSHRFSLPRLGGSFFSFHLLATRQTASSKLLFSFTTIGDGSPVSFLFCFLFFAARLFFLLPHPHPLPILPTAVFAMVTEHKEDKRLGSFNKDTKLLHFSIFPAVSASANCQQHPSSSLASPVLHLSLSLSLSLLLFTISIYSLVTVCLPVDLFLSRAH